MNTQATETLDDIPLLPCPFCGMTAPTVKLQSDAEIEEDDGAHSKYFAVVCDASSGGGGATQYGCGGMSGYMVSRKGAAQLWNRRAKVYLPSGQYYAMQPDGHRMLCNADGTRSIFDDVDE